MNTLAAAAYMQAYSESSYYLSSTATATATGSENNDLNLEEIFACFEDKHTKHLYSRQLQYLHRIYRYRIHSGIALSELRDICELIQITIESLTNQSNNIESQSANNANNTTFSQNPNQRNAFAELLKFIPSLWDCFHTFRNDYPDSIELKENNNDSLEFAQKKCSRGNYHKKTSLSDDFQYVFTTIRKLIAHETQHISSEHFLSILSLLRRVLVAAPAEALYSVTSSSTNPVLFHPTFISLLDTLFLSYLNHHCSNIQLQICLWSFFDELTSSTSVAPPSPPIEYLFSFRTLEAIPQFNHAFVQYLMYSEVYLRIASLIESCFCATMLNLYTEVSWKIALYGDEKSIVEYFSKPSIHNCIFSKAKQSLKQNVLSGSSTMDGTEYEAAGSKQSRTSGSKFLLTQKQKCRRNGIWKLMSHLLTIPQIRQIFNFSFHNLGIEDKHKFFETIADGLSDLYTFSIRQQADSEDYEIIQMLLNFILLSCSGANVTETSLMKRTVDFQLESLTEIVDSANEDPVSRVIQILLFHLDPDSSVHKNWTAIELGSIQSNILRVLSTMYRHFSNSLEAPNVFECLQKHLIAIHSVIVHTQHSVAGTQQSPNSTLVLKNTVKFATHNTKSKNSENKTISILQKNCATCLKLLTILARRYVHHASDLLRQQSMDSAKTSEVLQSLITCLLDLLDASVYPRTFILSRRNFIMARSLRTLCSILATPGQDTNLMVNECWEVFRRENGLFRISECCSFGFLLPSFRDASYTVDFFLNLLTTVVATGIKYADSWTVYSSSLAWTLNLLCYFRRSAFLSNNIVHQGLRSLLHLVKQVANRNQVFDFIFNWKLGSDNLKLSTIEEALFYPSTSPETDHSTITIFHLLLSFWPPVNWEKWSYWLSLSSSQSELFTLVGTPGNPLDFHPKHFEDEFNRAEVKAIAVSVYCLFLTLKSAASFGVFTKALSSVFQSNILKILNFTELESGIESFTIEEGLQNMSIAPVESDRCLLLQNKQNFKIVLDIVANSETEVNNTAFSRELDLFETEITWNRKLQNGEFALAELQKRICIPSLQKPKISEQSRLMATENQTKESIVTPLNIDTEEKCNDQHVATNEKITVTQALQRTLVNNITSVHAFTPTMKSNSYQNLSSPSPSMKLKRKPLYTSVPPTPSRSRPSTRMNQRITQLKYVTEEVLSDHTLDSIF